MATIVKRGNKYAVVYTYADKNNDRHQKWESFDTKTQAAERKAQIELEQINNVFIPPSTYTIHDLMDQYVNIYGVNRWSISHMAEEQSKINRYILPVIGNMKIEDATPVVMDKFYLNLSKMKKVDSNGEQLEKCITPNMIKGIHKTLHCAFNQALKWEIVQRNPVSHATLPKVEFEARGIWTVDQIVTALERCEDPIMALAINLSFSCTLRAGELLGLTWDCFNKEQDGSYSILVEKELQRVGIESAEKVNDKGVLFTFPPTTYSRDRRTKLVLKEPKTRSSKRRIYLPQKCAEMMLERKEEVYTLKSMLGDEYKDYNLVFAHPNGTPLGSDYLKHGLKKLEDKCGFPHVVFHSFRHASITYKLKWNGGDMKAVQGDSGHAELDMIANTYSHIIDEDRKLNAMDFNEKFYNGKGLKEENQNKSVPTPSFKKGVMTIDDYRKERAEKEEKKKQEEMKKEAENLVNKLLENPDAMAILKALIK